MKQSLEQTFRQAMKRDRANQFADAERLYRQILEQEPTHAQALHSLGVLLGKTGRLDEAINLIERSLVSDPTDAVTHYDLGLALQFKGRHADAVNCYRRALEIQPDHLIARNNLTIALRHAGRLDEAEATCREVLQRKPDYAEAHNSLGNILRDKKQLDPSIAAYRQATVINPKYARAHLNLGIALQEKGEIDEAISAYRQAIATQPDFLEAVGTLGNALKNRGRFEEAMAAYRQVIHLNPNLPNAYDNLGIVLGELGRLDEALAAIRHAIFLDSQFAEAYIHLGNVLKDKAQLSESIDAYRQAIALAPDNPDAHGNLALSLTLAGEVEPALAELRQALAINPNYPEIHSNLLLTLHYQADWTPEAIAEEHFRWNARHAEPLKKLIQRHTNDRDPERRLRIGYVSPDFRRHAVASFSLPLLSFHDHQQLEVFCYAESLSSDSTTERFRAQADHWRNTVGLLDSELAQRIRDDQIDILVDLAGHTSNNRLLTFAYKPAPVQVNWQGYADTTGLSAIDYRISDPFADPPGMTERYHSEQLVRLPETDWVFQPPEEGSEPAHHPMVEAITFGCFNNNAKVTESMLRLWARILGEVPGSRLLLKAMAMESQLLQRRVRKVFQEAGIGPERLELVGMVQSTMGHLALYNRMDIALDPYPYHGTSSTLEAFWMGVPVVTLAGKMHVSRVGVSLLNNVGLPELVARTEEEYVQIAVGLAKDLPRLTHLHETLRARMKQSPLMDAPRFARNVEAAYRAMWRKWCATPK